MGMDYLGFALKNKISDIQSAMWDAHNVQLIVCNEICMCLPSVFWLRPLRVAVLAVG